MLRFVKDWQCALSLICSVRWLIRYYRYLSAFRSYNLPLLRLYTYTYQESKTKFAVVHSLDGYDEISLTNEFKVATSDHEKIYAPESLGFSRYKETDLDGGQTPEDAAKIFDQIMNNTATEAQKNVVVVNSAFAIHVICPEKTIEECIASPKSHWKVDTH